jgi:hypothetical protein
MVNLYNLLMLLPLKGNFLVDTLPKFAIVEP